MKRRYVMAIIFVAIAWGTNWNWFTSLIAFCMVCHALSDDGTEVSTPTETIPEAINMTTRYPLAWPAGWPRTKSPKEGRFEVSFDKAVQELGWEVERMGGSYAVLSTNLELRLDGKTPRQGKSDPSDRGVAVYFMLNGKQKVFACDTYTTVRDNIRAIGLTIQALRSVDRYGASGMLERALRAFDALPPPKSCWDVLGIQATRDASQIEAAFRASAKTRHPDAGGSAVAFTELVQARDRALKGG